VWLSTDGIGQVWKLQTATPPFGTFQEGSLTFMYDSVAAGNGGTKDYATLVLHGDTVNMIFTSTDMGVTWATLVQPAHEYGSGGRRLIADLNGYLYLVGGANVFNQVYFSADVGNTWSVVQQENFNPNMTGAISVTLFQHGCLAMQFQQSSVTASGYQQVIAVYGGTLNAAQYMYSGFQCVTTSPSIQYSAAQVDIIFSGDGYQPPVTTTTSKSSNVPQVVFHSPANLLLPRSYPDCAYDVHALGRKSSSPSMWQLGGWTSTGAFSNTIEFSNSSVWSTFTAIIPVTTNGGSVPSRTAAGAGYLNNGVLLWFGGKESVSFTWMNDVWSSTNGGATFTLATGQAPWRNRSDISVAVMPNSNNIVIIGGQASTGGLNDCWLSSDGAGVLWTQRTTTPPFPPFQDAAFVSMYDGTSTAFATLVLYTGQNANVWSSTDAGSTWQPIAFAPWYIRQSAQFVADADNLLWFMGGNVATGDIWMSTDKGFTWAFIQQMTTSSVWPNVADYQSSQYSCLFTTYIPNALSPNGYHKQLVLYGGMNSIQVSVQPASSCVQSITTNQVFADVMYPSELSAAWTPTSSGVTVGVPTSQLPTVAYNSPTVMLTNRVQPICAVNVHAVLQHSSSPALYQLGGWDANGNALNTLDVISGNTITTFSYTAPVWGGSPAAGRASAGASVLSNGVLLWFGGLTSNQSTTVSTYVNDVWASNTSGLSFALSTINAPWTPRSGMSVAAMPGTLCTVMIGGLQSTGVLANDGILAQHTHTHAHTTTHTYTHA
jgi:hypothetical protein